MYIKEHCFKIKKMHSLLLGHPIKKKDNALSDHGFYSIIVLFGPHGLGTRLNISKNCKALTIYIYIVGGRCAMQEDKGKKERGFHFYKYRSKVQQKGIPGNAMP